MVKEDLPGRQKEKPNIPGVRPVSHLAEQIARRPAQENRNEHGDQSIEKAVILGKIGDEASHSDFFDGDLLDFGSLYPAI